MLAERPRVVAALLVAGLAVLLVTLVIGAALGASAASPSAVPAPRADTAPTEGASAEAKRAQAALAQARDAAATRERELEGDVRRWRRIAGNRGDALTRAERRLRRRN